MDHHGLQLAMRNHALTLSVVTTGSVSLSATATGYARITGSFLTDGFAVGMEVAGSGFTATANNDPKAITAVGALTLTCAGCSVEAAGTRTLTVGFPAKRAWENVPLEPIAGRPYIEEQYLPGPMRQLTLGPSGELELLPMYVLLVYAVANAGLAAATKYADALLALFTPRTDVTTGAGVVARVRTDVSPFRGQLRHEVPGWAVIPVTIPFRVRVPNTL